MTYSIVVSVLAGEQLREVGIVAMLEDLPGLSVHRFSASRCSDVVIADLTIAAGETMRPLIVSHELYGSTMVVITDEIVQADVGALAAAGAVTIMHTAEASRANVLAAIHRAAAVDELAGPPICAHLRDQLRRVRHVRAGAEHVALSERETAVLRYLSEGLGTVEIGKAMNISERTVKYVLWGVMRRFSLRNRVHAVAFAIRAGIV
jgi:DNA-binding NarL/FixJ family response regulator